MAVKQKLHNLKRSIRRSVFIYLRNMILCCMVSLYGADGENAIHCPRRLENSCVVEEYVCTTFLAKSGRIW